MLSYPPLHEDTPVEQHLYPKYALAATWNDQLHGNEPHFSDLLAGSFVHKLYFVKAKGGAQHEHVIAEIHNRDATVEPKVRILRLERASGNLRTRENAKRDQARTPEKRNSPAQEALDHSLDSSSESSKPKRDALDTVREFPGWPVTKKNLVYTMTFPDNDHVPTLEDLAIAASITAKHDEQYSLLLHQCYWWADTLMAIIESVVEEQYRVKTHYSDELVEDEQMTESNLSGKFKISWLTIPVHNRNSANINNLTSLFAAKKAYYADLVLMKRADRDARARAEEAQRAAEATAKADREAKAKAEATAKADRKAKAKAEATAKADREAKAKAEATAKADREAKAKAEATAKADREAKAKAEATAKADREAKAKAEATAKADREAKAKAEATAKADREAKVEAEAQAKADREAKVKAEATAKADREAKLEAEAKMKALEDLLAAHGISQLGQPQGGGH
ncbi:hypothetical protein DXG03_009134 [Asterophora parasitica]|uniref:Uncharacterized protein n=1 Tax=Asterophora parasitica TaxID=117018 RepID=A0A9P7KCQ6_9AGAR|nr:hypothetical protein DXG03_009134 [Asterophora parasitica]